MNYDDYERAVEAYRTDMAFVKKTHADFSERLERCRHNLALHRPHSLEVCRTCAHRHTFGAMHPYPGHDGCSELGVPVEDFWTCGLWAPTGGTVDKLARLEVDEDIVAESLH